MRPPATRFFLLLVALAAAAAPALCATYHLSPQGDDAGPGTMAQPWKTLAKANAALIAGPVGAALRQPRLGRCKLLDDGEWHTPLS